MSFYRDKVQIYSRTIVNDMQIPSSYINPSNIKTNIKENIKTMERKVFL